MARKLKVLHQNGNKCNGLTNKFWWKKKSRNQEKKENKGNKEKRSRKREKETGTQSCG
jgi:hypothetical protein